MNIIKRMNKPSRSALLENQGGSEQQQDIRTEEERGEILNTDAESQLWALLEALKTVKQGDFSVRLPVANNGVMGEIAEAFNDVVSLNASMANEIGRVSKIVGEEGKLPRSCL